jgi:hypothetical protein
MEDDNDLVDFGQILLAFESQRLSENLHRIANRFQRAGFYGELLQELEEMRGIANRLSGMSLELHGYTLTDEQKKAGVMP